MVFFNEGFPKFFSLRISNQDCVLCFVFFNTDITKLWCAITCSPQCDICGVCYIGSTGCWGLHLSQVPRTSRCLPSIVGTVASANIALLRLPWHRWTDFHHSHIRVTKKFSSHRFSSLVIWCLLGHVGRVAESCAVQSVGDSEVTLSWGEVENKELQHGERREEETHDKDDCPPVPAPPPQHQHCLHTLHQQLPPEILYSPPHAKRESSQPSPARVHFFRAVIRSITPDR